MRTLLSTRLFATRPLDLRSLSEAARAGFPSLQLFAAPGHFNPLRPEEVERLRASLDALELEAPWMHLDLSLLPRLRDNGALSWLTEALRILRIEVLSLPRRPWSQSQHLNGQRLPDLAAFVVPAFSAGAQLSLDAARHGERVLRHLRPDVSLCWDLAWSEGSLEQDREEAEKLLGGKLGRRIRGVRIAHGAAGHRELPGPREAELLEEAWRLHPLGILIYDVEDPTGFGSVQDWREALRELRDFHAGGSRPPHQPGGGLFWAGLAPG